MNTSLESADLPVLRVDVTEGGTRSRKGRLACGIGTNLTFDTAKMESYFFAEWQPVLYDALLVAAAVEFCDKTLRRPKTGWGREFELRIPVHEPERWSSKDVAETLHDTLTFLTGDVWRISFSARKHKAAAPRQGQFNIGTDVAAVIPFSEGMDSQAAAGLASLKLGSRLVRVRLGTKQLNGDKASRRAHPFTSIPYSVDAGEGRFVESTARSRGFKFALISGLAAHLAKASQVIVPESGQGALGPTLVPVGQAYTDYRSHPLFTVKMEQFLAALVSMKVHFVFPQLWSTKGETLARYVAECGKEATTWASTWSCWQQNRHVSVDGKKRQCGICAACMLRRLSVHAAGLSEQPTTYVWENLGASDFSAGAAITFERNKITRALKQYAIAGTLHFDHLASVRQSKSNQAAMALSAHQLAEACTLSDEDVRARLDRFLCQHEMEWKNFIGALGPDSFVMEWATGVR